MTPDSELREELEKLLSFTSDSTLYVDRTHSRIDIQKTINKILALVMSIFEEPVISTQPFPDASVEEEAGICPIHRLPLGALRIHKGWSFPWGECVKSLERQLAEANVEKEALLKREESYFQLYNKEKALVAQLGELLSNLEEDISDGTFDKNNNRVEYLNMIKAALSRMRGEK